MWYTLVTNDPVVGFLTILPDVSARNILVCSNSTSDEIGDFEVASILLYLTHIPDSRHTKKNSRVLTFCAQFLLSVGTGQLHQLVIYIFLNCREVLVGKSLHHEHYLLESFQKS